MIQPIKAGFEFEGVVVPFDRLLPTKRIPDNLKETAKFKTILASIQEVGVIEPLNVFPQKGGKYLLLDGHVRVEALRQLGQTEALCLVSTDDEGYTYNQKVNRVAPIQANRMILKALDSGVPEERIAKALNITVSTVRHNRGMLAQICSEAVELLKHQPVSLQALREIKKVHPIRQIEIAEIMVAAGTYTATYARALIIATPKEQLVDGEATKKLPGMKPEDLARMEHELRVIEKDFALIDESYSQNVMNLTIARGYVKKLLENAKVVRYLAQKHRDLLAELQKITEASALEA